MSNPRYDWICGAGPFAPSTCGQNKQFLVETLENSDSRALITLLYCLRHDYSSSWQTRQHFVPNLMIFYIKRLYNGRHISSRHALQGDSDIQLMAPTRDMVTWKANLARDGHRVILVEARDDQVWNLKLKIPSFQLVALADIATRWDFVKHNDDEAQGVWWQDDLGDARGDHT